MLLEMYSERCVIRLYLFLEILELVENVRGSRAYEREAGNLRPLIRTTEGRRMQRDALHMGRGERISIFKDMQRMQLHYKSSTCSIFIIVRAFST